MNLKVLLPEKVILDETVQRVVAEAEDGSFGILPRHVDFVTAVVPGIMTFIKEDGEESFVATDEGILLKQGRNILVSVQNGVRADKLGELEQAVTNFLSSRGELEQRSRYALGLLEADFLRRFVEME